ncbi:MAG: tyrosine-type recombinase/integrase [Treponema sp.]|jgi:integrase|nr:tyrosine-type recombinase/integrase [Treponema sp.]
MHNDFTLFPRKLLSGKKVFYYYAYNSEGVRLGPWSTGQTGKTAARNYCNCLNREGKLLRRTKNVPAFAEYSAGFWDWEKSVYLRDRTKRRFLTQSYADKCARIVKKNLVPYFGKMRIDKINSDVMEKWFDHLLKNGYKNSTINGYYRVIRTMLAWAAKKKIISGDPLLNFERLMENKKEIELVTHDEFHSLFSGNWRRVWDNDFLHYAANKLAALTGMRCSEVLGLRGEFVYDDHLFLCGQYDHYGYRLTKTKTQHHIPLTAELAADLKKLKKINGDGFLFSHNGGVKPVSHKHLANGLVRALENIGLSAGEIRRRGLSLHAWRHFCNTEMQKAGLSVQKIQAITGHKSARMTDWYTHFDPAEFSEVPDIQAMLLKPKRAKLST